MGVDVSEMEGIDVGSFVVLKMKEGPSLVCLLFPSFPFFVSLLCFSHPSSGRFCVYHRS